MNLKSKRLTLLILGITAMVCSRAMFVFFDDPEGPNLLIVTILAGVLYFLSLAAYSLNLSGFKKFVLAIFIQIIIAISLYFLLS